MFCVLNVETRKNTLNEKLFGKFIKDKYDLHLVPVFKAAPFYTYNVTVGKRGADWEKIIFCTGKCAKRFVISENTVLPKIKGVGIFKSDILYKKLIQNTFSEILKSCKNKMPVTVVDLKGEAPEYLYALAPFAGSLSVVTNEKSKFKRVCANIQAETGLSVPLVSKENRWGAKIDIAKSAMTIIKGENVLSFSKGSDFKVPEIYEKLLPKGVKEYDFYSALYELCGVFSLGECVFENIILNNEKIALSELDISGIF